MTRSQTDLAGEEAAARADLAEDRSELVADGAFGVSGSGDCGSREGGFAKPVFVV